jgi:type III pantothenate kinase
LFLAVDVGNTRITLAVLDGDEVVAGTTAPSDPSLTAETLAARLARPAEGPPLPLADVAAAAFCCVVPRLAAPVAGAVRTATGVAPLAVTHDLDTGIRIALEDPDEIGGDRLANAAAGRAAVPGRPVLVLDFGTATTFDAVSAGGEYRGGAIAPGLGMAAEALHAGTARLPRVPLAPPRDVIGRNTVEAMQSGIVCGYACLVEGLTARLRERLGVDTAVLATGGYAELLRPLLDCIDTVDPYLTLRGVKIIHDRNRPQKK